MNATVTLEAPHRSHVRARLFATAVALAAIGGGTAAVIANDSGTTTKPSVVTPTPAADSHDDPLVSRFGESSPIPDDHIYNGRR